MSIEPRTCDDDDGDIGAIKDNTRLVDYKELFYK